MPEGQDLNDLVNAPKETLAVEIKSNLDLESDVHRASLARHIAALANYGGGYIVFGFGNDLKPIPLPDDIDKAFHPDRISSITRKYLEPAVLCDVVMVQSSTGQRHPVLRVPAHGATPVCAGADGPQDPKGRVQAITSGRYYIRAVGNSGPESVALTRPDQWHALIRRLLTADRAALAAIIERAIDPARPEAKSATALDAWHDMTAAAFVTRVNR
jgi:Putative DNA-binding domain